MMKELSFWGELILKLHYIGKRSEHLQGNCEFQAIHH